MTFLRKLFRRKQNAVSDRLFAAAVSDVLGDWREYDTLAAVFAGTQNNPSLMIARGLMPSEFGTKFAAGAFFAARLRESLAPVIEQIESCPRPIPEAHMEKLLAEIVASVSESNKHLLMLCMRNTTLELKED